MNHRPFRWNLARRQQLGSLLDGPVAEDYPGFLEDVRACCVRIAASAADGTVVFVGRSPESLFDYLSGILAETLQAEHLVLLNFSMRDDTVDGVSRAMPHALRAMQDQFASLRLSPEEIATSEYPLIFVDLVYRGYTFGHLLELLEFWAVERGIDVAAVRRRIRFIGITERTKNSPNTWRWYQQVLWAQRLPRRSLRSISVPYRLWTYLGDYQKKMGRWNPPQYWGAEHLALPPRDTEALEALRLAYSLYRRGSGAERHRFAAMLALQPEIRHSSVRRLILELRHA